MRTQTLRILSLTLALAALSGAVLVLAALELRTARDTESPRPPSEDAEPTDIESAREACRKTREWPRLPAEVEGCPVDWDDPESVSAHVVRPSKVDGPDSNRRPVLPSDEKILPGGLFLEYLISEEGEVVDVCVLRSASPFIDAYFVDIAKRTSFTPARICDEPVPFSLIVTVFHHAWDWPREPESRSEP